MRPPSAAKNHRGSTRSSASDPRLARHIANAVLKQDSHDTRIIKEAKNSGRKIDFAAAAVMAFDRACVPPQPVPMIHEWPDEDTIAQWEQEGAGW
jgi:phage terminase large subunit-like protein